MDKLKLKWRIFTFQLGFCALLLLVLWFFQTVLLTDMYKYIRKEELQKAVTLVGKNINSPDLQEILDDLARNKEIIVMTSQEFNMPLRPEQEGRGRRGPESITQTETFTLSDGRNVSLTFYALISPVDATVSTLRMQLYIITGIMLLLSIIIALIISWRVSKPIEKINSSAKLLASGNYDTHFDGRDFLEVKELSDTLNTAATELSKVETLRRELMANVSHDLRTPLALIYSYAEMMHDFPDEITKEQTQIIMDETQRLTSLVNDVLDVSQFEMGTMVLTKSVYNLTESISSTIDRISELVKSDGYTLCFEHGDDIFVNADEGKIMQAFYNLLINAIHYSGEIKNVVIRQNVSNGFAKIEVIDSGDGIAEDDLPFIWDRYYKSNKKHKRAITGTGLGLSIVKKIIELHEGTYGVTSELGKRSTFWFTINIS
ncbi:MAG: HAMP domain-containing histidine kinase [Oscillospiraceae bacterium]|nr:HAMP domain-containing histidine kinase [Oscillospiraceae bacterium]